MSTKNAISAAGVGAVISAAKEDSEALKFTYTSSSSLTTGFQSNVTMPGGHMLIVDEPKTMPGGQNKGANPLDLMCASFGTCQEITYKMYATAMGIPLESVSAHIVGDINLNGLVGNGGPVGFKKIQGTITVVSDAEEEQLKKLKAVCDAHCPLLATLRQKIACNVDLIHKDPQLSEAKVTALNEALKSDPVQKGGLMAVISAGKQDEDALQFTYESSSKLSTNTLMTEVTMPQGHKMVIDEPTTMPGGNNDGPNPLDVFCASLGTCQEITWKMYATVMGVPVSSISCKVEAPIDLRGLVGLADNAVPFKSVSVQVTVTSPASKATLVGLKGAIDAHCPMVATIKNEIPVELSLEVKKPAGC